MFLVFLLPPTSFSKEDSKHSYFSFSEIFKDRYPRSSSVSEGYNEMWNGTWIVVDSPLPRYTAAKSKSSLKRSLRGSQVPKSFSLSLSLYSRAYPTIEHVSSVLQRGNQPCKINRFETLGPDAGEEVPRMWLHPFNFFKWNWREENS